MKLSTLARLLVSALALTALGCSDAATEEDASESAEAELTSTSRAFVGRYRWQEGTDYLDYAALDLRSGSGSWARYEAEADVALTGSLIMCVRAPCTSAEKGKWRVTKYRGKSSLKLRPDAGGERSYTITRSATGGVTLTRSGSTGELAAYEPPCNLIDCQPGMVCREDQGVGVCVPSDPCMTVRCTANTHCEATPAGGAACIPNVSPCAAMLCGPNTTCVEENGQGVCKPATTCVKTGCSGQICAAQERVTTCNWRPEYACYQTAICEVGANGQCGFRQTAALAACLATP